MVSFTSQATTIEPSVGFAVGDFYQSFRDVEGPTFSSSSSSVTGTQSGLDLGLKVYDEKVLNLPLFVGLDFTYSALSLDSLTFGQDKLYSDITASRLQLGGILGLNPETAWLPRIWFGIMVIDIYTLTADSHTDDYSGFGYKFGISFGQTYRFNIEYRSSEYKVRNEADLPVRYEVNDIELTEGPLETTELVFSLSMPLEL